MMRNSTSSSVYSGIAGGESAGFVFVKTLPPRGLKNIKDHVEGIEIPVPP
jgi:hypothetical protein